MVGWGDRDASGEVRCCFKCDASIAGRHPYDDFSDGASWRDTILTHEIFMQRVLALGLFFIWSVQLTWVYCGIHQWRPDAHGRVGGTPAHAGRLLMGVVPIDRWLSNSATGGVGYDAFIHQGSIQIIGAGKVAVQHADTCNV